MTPLLPPGRWIRSALFRSYLGAFAILWVAMKGAMTAGAVLLRQPPFAFQPFGEAVICAVELGVLSLFLRRSREDILLGNLGLSMGVALAPLVAVHVALSLAVSLLA